MQALKDNGTWELTSVLLGKHATGSRWIYKIKYNATGSIEWYKVCLVAKDYTQVEGEDSHNAFPLVVNIGIVHLLFSIEAIQNQPLHQVDVNDAFLQGYLNKDIYMLPPPGYSKAKLG